MTLTLPFVLEPEVLLDHINHSDLLIIDLCPSDSYHQGHVPGAVHLDFRDLLEGIAPSPGKLPSKEQLTHVFARLGLTEKTHVVAYDNEGGGWAGRLLWTLDVIGHSHSSYLNGGWIAWENEGHPVDTQHHIRTPNESLSITLNEAPIADKNYILKRLGSEDLAIWDARSPEEYAGTKVVAQKGGHIPGAVNFEWTQAMDPKRNYRILGDNALNHTLTQLGITKDKEVITHCQSHHRSGYTYLVAKSLGFKQLKAYPGSWSEWGNDPETPVEC